MPRIDATRIAPRLHIGSFPPPGTRLPGVATLILCARELQPPPGAYGKGIEVIRAGFDDSERPDRATFTRAQAAASIVAERVRAGQRCLVTCALGRNRSGLVVALALHKLTGAPGAFCRRRVQGARPNALTNGAFAAFLDSIPARRI